MYNEKRVDIILKHDNKEFSFEPDRVNLEEIREYLGTGNHVVKYYNLTHFKKEQMNELRDLQGLSIKDFYETICNVLYNNRK